MKTVFKRCSALLLTIVMVLSLCTSALADTNSKQTNKITGNETGTITVQGVESGATVKAYRFMENDIQNGVWQGFKLIEALKTNSVLTNATTGIQVTKNANSTVPKDAIQLTKDHLNAILANISSIPAEKVITLERSGNNYTKAVPAGYYLILVSATASATVYNPMLAGVYYDYSTAGVAGGTVAATGNMTLKGATVYAKSEAPTLTKKITNTDSNTNTNDHGNDVAIGDTVNYEITTTIPAYSKAHKPYFVVADELSSGLTYADAAPVVKVGTTELTSGTDYFYTKTSSTKMNIRFATNYLLGRNASTTVKITYSAVLGASAAKNFDPNTNTVDIYYSHTYDEKAGNDSKPADPEDPDGPNKPGIDPDNPKYPEPSLEDKTYTYTFELDGALTGTTTTIENGNGQTIKVTKTHELIKVDDSGAIAKVEKGETSEVVNYYIDSKVTTKTVALAGAKFTLTSKTTPAKVYEATTDSDGHMTFTGLDAGEYTLKETEAPEGYTLNATEVPVKIEADYNTDGTLKEYKVTVNNDHTSTYTATYTADDTTTVAKDPKITKIIYDVTTTGVLNPYGFINTRLIALPSTGGMGTYIFTILGVAIMAIFAFLLFRGRKAEDE